MRILKQIVIMKKCTKCGQQFADTLNACPNCGNPVQMVQSIPNQQQYAYAAQSDKSKTTAGILALLLGGLGIHYFYVGKAAGGLICILLTLITCGLWWIVLLIQGFMMLSMTQEDFDRKYVYSQSTFPLF